MPFLCPLLTHKEDEDEAGQCQGRPAADHADEEAEEGVQQQRGPEQPVEERPGPAWGHQGRLWKGARLVVLLLEGVLGTEGDLSTRTRAGLLQASPEDGSKLAGGPTERGSTGEHGEPHPAGPRGPRQLCVQAVPSWGPGAAPQGAAGQGEDTGGPGTTCSMRSDSRAECPHCLSIMDTWALTVCGPGFVTLLTYNVDVPQGVASPGKQAPSCSKC